MQKKKPSTATPSAASLPVSKSKDQKRRETLDTSSDSSESDSEISFKNEQQHQKSREIKTPTASAKAVTKRKSSSEESGTSSERSGQNKSKSGSSKANKTPASSSAAPTAISTSKSAKDKAKHEKNEREKLELDKKMSKIFGSSSDEEEDEDLDQEHQKSREVETTTKARKLSNIGLSDSDKEQQKSEQLASSDLMKTNQVEKNTTTAKKVKKERTSSGRSSTGSRSNRETAESLFDQLTVNTDDQPIKTELASPQQLQDNKKSINFTEKVTKSTSEGYTVFAEGAPKEAVSSPKSVSAGSDGAVIKTEKRDSVEHQEDDLPPATMELSELDKSIASITEEVKEKVNTSGNGSNIIKNEDNNDKDLMEEAAANSVVASSNSKRTVISQEETDQAVTALLGESFENSFDEKLPKLEEVTGSTGSVVTQMDTSEPGGTQPPGIMEDVDDEAAKAVAGLASSEQSDQDQFEVQQGGTSQEQPQDLQTVLATEQLMPSSTETGNGNDSTTKIPIPPPAAEIASPPVVVAATTETTPKTSTRGRGGRGRGRGRTSTINKEQAEQEQQQQTPNTNTTTTRGGRGRGSRGGSGRVSTRGSSAAQQNADVSESSDVEMKSPIETEVSTAPTTTTRGGRGGRGRGRGRGSGSTSATTASTVAAANSSSRRRSSETSTDSMSNKSLTTTATPSATGATTVATSVFDWEEDESEMMASPTLRKENAKNKTMQQQNQLSIDTGNESTSGKKELESTSSSTPVKSPNVQPPTTKAATPNRQRRSTGSNSRSSKESAGEDEVIISPSTAANSALAQATNNKQETEEKIKAILEQAKQQQEQTAALGLLKEVVQPQQQQQPQAVAVAATPVSTPAHHPLPAAQVTATSPAAAALIQVQQRPTVLTTRMPVSSANQPGAAAAVPITSTAATTTLAFPTQPHSMRPQVVQLPTQPIPPSEIARQTTKQVLLEPKAGASGGVTASAQAASQAQAAASAASSQQNKMVSPNKLVAIPTTSPRGPVPAATSITLPTQPVPMSQTQLNSVTNSIVAKTMAMSMLPNQPLPPQHQPMTVLAAAQAQAQAQAQQQQQQQHHQQQQQQQPKLPQHPVPPVMPPTSATSITLVPAPNNRSASPVKPQHVALKKREYMASALAAAAASNAEHNHNKDVMHVDQKPPVGLGGPDQHQQPSVSSPAPPPTSVYPNPRKDHMKPRDAFGRGAHLIKEEPKPSLQQQQHSQAIKPLHQPPPPSSPSLPSLDQLIMMRDQEMQMVYQSLIKQGNTEQMATYVASQMATDRYKSAIDQILQLNNERPSSRDHHVGGPPGGHHGGPGDAFNAPIAHAHSRHPNPYVHDPFNRGAAAAAAAAMINLNSSGGPLGGPVVPGQPGGQVTSQVPRQPPPSSPEPTEFAYPSLEAYPVVWQGHLGLKNESASVQFHYISGCKELARNSLPLEPIPHMATLRIGQRMRLEDAHLSGVRTKMQQNGEHCVLLALPCGKDPSDVEAQSRQLREHFITYLQLKGAAGIVNVPGVEGGYVVHVFPSCDFANETMTSIAPDLLARVAEIEHMVIVIATVLDKAAASMT